MGLLDIFKGLGKNKQVKQNRVVAMYRNPTRSGMAGGAKWSNGLARSGEIRHYNHYETRKNARKSFHDSIQAHTLVKRKTDIVIDRGLTCEPNPDYELLGITPDQASAWSKTVKKFYDLWANSKKSHRSETNNYFQNQRLAMDCLTRDGEYFIRNYWTSDKDCVIPFQIEFLDPDQIRGDAYTYTTYQPVLDDGIIRDNRGREKAFKVWTIDRENGQMNDVDLPKYGNVSNFQYVVHGFIPDYPGQGRGMPEFAHALQELENITDLSSAVIKKHINLSNIVLYVKPSPDNPASNVFETVQGGGVGSDTKKDFVNQYGDKPVPSSTASNVGSTEAIATYYPLEADLGIPGSTGVFALREGEDLLPFAHTSPAESYNTFIESLFTDICASQRIPYEVMLMKFNSNYSASRAALITAWRYALIMQSEMISDMLQPHYEMLVTIMVSMGMISAPGFNDPLIRAAWLRCNFTGTPMPNIDPVKEASAKRMEIEIGANNIERATLELNGSSAENNIRINKSIFDILKDVIPPWLTWGKATELEPEQDSGKDTDEEENNN